VIEKVPIVSHFLKLIAIASKEVAIVKSQKFAILLIILYPLLVIGLTGFAFNGSNFGMLVSNLVAIVLILTCMLLSSITVIIERVQNVTLRLNMSVTWRSMFIAGKVLGQLAIAILEAGIIFAVAFFKFELPFSILGVNTVGFGLILPAAPVDLFLAVILISISFISMGLLVASFAKSQSTAVLATLLLIVPMLFLSGIILPIEAMGGIMQFISSNLPLTVANNLLTGIIVKGISIFEFGFEAGYLIVFSVVLLLISFFKKD
jgi:ABC-2 type transport system permease protein